MRICAHGGIEQIEWRDLPVRALTSNEVRVAVQAVGLNHLDLWVRRGVPGHKFPLPLTPGSDAAGHISEIGSSVRNLQVGDRVVVAPGIGCGTCEPCLNGLDHRCRRYEILGENRDGTCADSVIVPASHAISLPARVSLEEGACFVLSALTAWTMLVERAAIRAGEKVLVLSGGSGLGVMAIQIARLHGCRVIATGGGEQKCRQIEALGVRDVIDHSREDILDAVRARTDKEGVDVVVEHVGEKTWSASLKSLVRGGRLVTCGATSGARGDLDIRQLFFKNLSVLGSTMGPVGLVPKLVRLLVDGLLKPIVHRSLEFADIREAHQLLENREVFGKIVLRRSVD
ncbi:MAG: zinc-binding dehydrogenase [Planctomycetota bacterium]